MTLLDYIKGDRRGAEAHRLEKAAMDDPFLADALEGFDAVAGDHIRTVESLKRRITARSAARRGLAVRWSAAAALLALVTAGGFFLLRPNRETVVETVSPPVLTQIARPEADRASAEDSAEIEGSSTVAERSVQIAQATETEEVVTIFSNPTIVPVQETAKIELPGSNVPVEEELDFVPAPPTMATRSTGFLSDSAAPPPAYTKTDVRVQAERAAAEKEVDINEVVIIGFGEQLPGERTGSVTAAPAAEPGRPAGGMEAYRSYIRTHMIPPRDAEGRAVKGRVLLEFRVNRKGRPAGIRVVEGLTPEVDREARRLLESGPDWNRADSRVRIAIEF